MDLNIACSFAITLVIFDSFLAFCNDRTFHAHFVQFLPRPRISPFSQSSGLTLRPEKGKSLQCSGWDSRWCDDPTLFTGS